MHLKQKSTTKLTCYLPPSNTSSCPSLIATMPRNLLIKRSSSIDAIDEEIIDVGEPEKVMIRSDDDHRVPTTPLASPTGQQHPLVLSPQSPFEAYSARLRSEADYARYKACKESAQAFYSRLATLSALQSYYMQQQQTGSPLSPILISQLQQQFLARAAAAAASSPTTTSPLEAGTAKAGMDLSLKTVGLGSPTLKPMFSSKRPSPVGEQQQHPPSGGKKAKLTSTPRRKAARKLAFDDDKTSPVSGTLIRELAEGEEIPAIRKGDIPPEFNVVEITEEAKAELAKIENIIGDYACRLCKEVYPDAFGLAQHRCTMIVHVEYRCPECDKVFNCPANLASHRRWHKPRPAGNNNNNNNNEENNNKQLGGGDHVGTFPCDFCTKSFKRSHSLRKHLQQSHADQVLQADKKIVDSSEENNSSPMSSPSSSRYSIAELLSPSKENRTTLRCRLCPDIFSNLAELSQHLSQRHSNHSSPEAGGGLLQPLLRPQPFLPPVLSAFPH